MAGASQARAHTALAVALGYTVNFRNGADTIRDDPDSFSLRDVRVFETARGWRVAVLYADGTFMPSSDAEFHLRLTAALKHGVIRARPTTEADMNPLLPHLRAILRQIQSGDRSNGKNPYSDPVVKAALHAIKDVTGDARGWMDVNEPEPKLPSAPPSDKA